MESHVFGKHPEIAAIKQQLLDGGAAYAAMSGSGSSVFGLFRKRPRLNEFPRGYSTWALPL
jgi:4-diphosphocytidyl-2-C-methyl-D-erythritol kinase